MLYIVGTPIGNLGDMSPRGIETLKTVDFIAAEDTRVTRKLLSRFDIHTPLISYHEHNRAESGQKILESLLNGQSCALVTDAGMPVISDPGHDLVELCHQNGVKTAVVPGPCAVSAAAALSGLVEGRFCFEGFLTTAKRNREEHLKSLAAETRPMVFYEAPHKLISTLKDMLRHFGDRNIAIAREMTKIHEEVLRLTLEQALELYTQTPPKGEFVLVIEGAKPITTEIDPDAAYSLALQLAEQGMSVRDAARSAAAQTGFSRSEIYKYLTAH